jgi:hypothetical protein
MRLRQGGRRNLFKSLVANAFGLELGLGQGTSCQYFDRNLHLAPGPKAERSGSQRGAPQLCLRSQAINLTEFGAKIAEVRLHAQSPDKSFDKLVRPIFATVPIEVALQPVM